MACEQQYCIVHSKDIYVTVYLMNMKVLIRLRKELLPVKSLVWYEQLFDLSDAIFLKFLYGQIELDNF